MSSYIGNAVLESASAVPSTPTGNIAATNVQAAITELDVEKEPADATILKQVDIGTTANKLVQMDATAKLPAVDGSQLTGVYAGLGVNQTWQDVTASRALSTTYTNNTGRPIYVLITSGYSAASGVLELYIDGIRMALTDFNSSAGGALWVGAIIPNNSTYKCLQTYFAAPTTWGELR